MATGDSKRKWVGNGKEESDIGLNGNSSFEIDISYPGKQPIADVLNLPPAEGRLLWGNAATTSAITNRLYYGDNLPILAGLISDADVFGKVRLVYIDPPFATNKVFKSRNQSDAYQDTLTGAHWLEFLRQRLIFIHRLLADDGSIYVHLDTNAVFEAKLILDEIFGRKNFRNFIVRRKCNPKNYTRKAFGNIADYILFYTKADVYVWNRPYEAWSDAKADKEYIYTEQETGRRYKKVPIHAPGTRNGETGKEWRGMLPPPGKHWQFRPATLDEMNARGEIFWSSNGNPRRKSYLDDSVGIPIQDIWWDVRDAHNQNIKITGYPTEKNPDLLERLIKASSNPGDLVLDCFSGSGTSLAVADELDRRWIGIDNSPTAIGATLERFSVGTAAMGDFVQKRKENHQPELPDFSHLTHSVVDDFQLFVSTPYNGEIDESLDRWRRTVSP